MLNSGLSITIIIACVGLALVTLFYIGLSFVETFRKERVFKGNGIKGVATILGAFAVIGGFEYCLYNAPTVLAQGFSWPMLEEWGPAYFIQAIFCLAIVVPIFGIYFIQTHFWEKRDDKPYFMIIVFSIISGIGNSMIIFIINEALNRTFNGESRRAAFESRLYLFFILGIVLFAIASIVARKRLVVLTSYFVYEKRIFIINKIIKVNYDRYEQIKQENTMAALNNDTEVISGFVTILVNGLTGIITMITCFIYLCTMTLYGTLFTIMILVLAVLVFLRASSNAEKMFEINRDAQNVFFKNIYGLVYGFRELFINKKKREEFCEDVCDTCALNRDTRIKGEFSLINAAVFGETLYIGVIGLIVFIFPMLFYNIQENTFRNYVTVCLYLGGMVNSEVSLISGLMRVLVSWKRIKEYNEAISMEEDSVAKVDTLEQVKSKKENLTISFRDVTFSYKNEDGEQFTVGPINYDFKSGEIVFISGGNGSGKSTLAKMLTGLYRPDSGEITVNGRKVDCETLGSYFTTVYSDFYLFEKLYGIPHNEKQKEIEKYLKVLKIDNKVQVNDGVFSTVKLSTGQRKRMALLVSYLEDREAFLFDEWAADQDPEFKRFFYQEILPELKAKGKTIIAITHDDRYFGEADKHIKMEMGKIVS
ncbi:cyclic peptide export ABC transporter [Acetivibrio cellulolyticus]|uniref:cyclic peptide export ABC transporter n=1 Tax=Acetivibrio cellulolyticus TaxID=35830 RepID=UPI0001E2DEBD|nr:cyclic peptide export ABC transporter [Acetivibrio cellulolyticus]